MLRNLVQSALTTSRLQNVFANSSVGEATAEQFIAGHHVTDAVDTVLSLKQQGLLATVERLIEAPSDESGSRTNTMAQIDVVRTFAGANLSEDLDITVQLATLGLGLANGEAIATENLIKVCQAAADENISITLGMGDVEDVPASLRVVHDVVQRFPTLGLTLQSSLFRSEQDAAVFAASGARVRLCKGAFADNKDVAYTNKADVDKAFVREMRTLLNSSAYVMIATHDSRLLQIGQALALRGGRKKDSFEFQMYLGVATNEQTRLVGLDHRVRIHVPFGEQWYPVVAERVASQPSSLFSATRTLIRRKQ
jgi:proline dehydrogenase